MLNAVSLTTLILVVSLRKSDVFSLVVDSARNRIIRRLDEAEKAAYSDLLDSAEHVNHLTSTGNFNYHLDFLLKNSVITRRALSINLLIRGKSLHDSSRIPTGCGTNSNQN
jgi:hypothetical protein